MNVFLASNSVVCGFAVLSDRGLRIPERRSSSVRAHCVPHMWFEVAHAFFRFQTLSCLIAPSSFLSSATLALVPHDPARSGYVA